VVVPPLPIPTTFDHLGCPSPLAHRFLFGSPTHNPGPPLDNHTGCRLPTNTQALIDHATGPSSALSGLLPAADEAFRRTCPRRWYGNTYHTRTPRQWAVQFLGLILTRAYARHLHTTRARLLSGTAPSPSSPHPGLTAVFRYSRRQVVAGSHQSNGPHRPLSQR
jgi:hypothetical protein